MKKFNPKEILMPVIVLCAICIVTSALLAVTNDLTAPKIADLAKQTELESRQKVLSTAAEFEEKQANDIAYCIGKDGDGKPVGYVFTTESKGYGGAVQIMVGVTMDKKVAGVEILSIDETPGLGMNAKNESFLTQFIDKTIGVSVVKNNPSGNQIQALTGATITSNAVTDAINLALEAANEIGGAENG